MMNLKHLPNQRENEKLVLFLRRHWITIARLFISFLLLTFVPIALGVYFFDRLTVWLAQPFLGPIIVIAISIYFLCIWLFSFVEFTDYYLDTWIITTERIISIEQKGLFERVASELDLVAVQDATAETSGILETMLTYGDVLVQTAGEQERFHFFHIDNPEQVKETVMKLALEAKQRLSAHGNSPIFPTT